MEQAARHNLASACYLAVITCECAYVCVRWRGSPFASPDKMKFIPAGCSVLTTHAHDERTRPLGHEERRGPGRAWARPRRSARKRNAPRSRLLALLALAGRRARRAEVAGAFCHTNDDRSLPATSLSVTHSLCRGAPSGLFASASTLGAHPFPFGPDGPILEVQRRCTSTVTVCVHGFWLLFMVGTLLALGLSGFSLFCHWVWLLSTLFAGATFAGYWVAQQHEAWLIFWTLWMVHGLLWLQLVLVASKGVWPGTLWANFETHSGTDLLMAQLGSVPLCARPPTARHLGWA